MRPFILSVILLAFFSALLPSPSQAQTVFINELHYDNDPPINTEEFVEVAGPADTDLTGWSIVFYNGANGAMYGTENLAGMIPDLCGGYGVIARDRDVIQPGNADGLALIDGSSGADVVIQFLSYEGVLVATDGPANGMTSTDIGVGQSSGTPFGHSLQLAGAGTTYTDFSWAPPAANTKGACNAGQNFGAQSSVYLTVSSALISENGDVTGIAARLTAAVAFDVTVTLGFAGTATGPGQDYIVSGTEIIIPNGQTFGGIQITGQDDDEVEQNETVEVSILSVTAPVAIGAPSQVSTIITSDDVAPLSPILINEVDADQTDTDVAEFVELFDGGVGNTILDGLVLVLFNGNGRSAYNAWDLDGYSTDAGGYFVLCNAAANVPNCDLDAGVPDNMIQNGPDAVALYVANATDFPNGTVVTATNEVDGFVYDTNDADTQDLWVLINPGQPQVNEDELGTKDVDSNQRIPNGAGGARNTSTYTQAPPTPGKENELGPASVSLSVLSDTIQENNDTAVVMAKLSHAVVSDVTIALRFSGTANGPDPMFGDYRANDSIVIAAGETTGGADVVTIDDLIHEGGETVVVQIVSATADVVIGNPDEVTLTILDDEVTSTVMGFLLNDAVSSHGQGITLNEISARSYSKDYNADTEVASQVDKDEFIEIVNAYPNSVDINGWILGDNNDNFVISGLNPVEPSHSVVVFGRGADVSNFDPGPGNQVISVTDLALDNENDAIGIKNADGIYIGASWGSTSPNNTLNADFRNGATLAFDIEVLEHDWREGQSQTRSPEYTGPWERHSALIGAYNWSVDMTVEIMDPQASPGRHHQSGTVLDTNEASILPETTVLRQNYPNPFNPVTTISYGLTSTSYVRLTVSDIIGRRIVTLVDGVVRAGEHQAIFDANRLPTGVYLYRLEANGLLLSNRMVLLK